MGSGGAGAGGGVGVAGGDVQAMALRGHCLWYCRRDRADFICSVRSGDLLVLAWLLLSWL